MQAQTWLGFAVAPQSESSDMDEDDPDFEWWKQCPEWWEHGGDLQRSGTGGGDTAGAEGTKKQDDEGSDDQAEAETPH